MEYSENYQKVLRFYKMKLWNVDRVRDAVVKGWITPSEFLEITGIPYA